MSLANPTAGQNCRLVRAAATEAAMSLPVGFDFTILLSIFAALFPILQNLMNGCTPAPTPTAADYRNFLVKRYRRGSYPNSIVRHARREAAEQAATNGAPVNHADAESIGIALLDKVRTGSDEDISEVMQLTAAA
jgi:hypothetical protein